MESHCGAALPSNSTSNQHARPWTTHWYSGTAGKCHLSVSTCGIFGWAYEAAESHSAYPPMGMCRGIVML